MSLEKIVDNSRTDKIRHIHIYLSIKNYWYLKRI